MKTIFRLFLLLSVMHAKAQSLNGIIVDRNSHSPIAYATVNLFDATGKSVYGTITDEEGKFLLKEIKEGSYRLNCNFISYQTLTLPVTINGGINRLGTLFLLPETKQLNEVTIAAQQPALRLQADKKVFEVGRDVLSQNGSVNDVLNGIPSVAVSPQGEVSLRGNTGVTVLINGRRSGLTQGAVLAQLQASQVERIEVITSPSARYDASGDAGIINIILKKNKNTGFNGQLKVVAGLPNDSRINPSLNYKSDRFNLFTTLGMRKSDYKGRYATDQVADGNVLSLQQGENRHDDGKMLYLGGDYFMSSKRTMTVAYLWNGTHDHDKTALNYNYHGFAADSTLYRNGESWERRNYHQLEYNYTQLFLRDKQKWTIDLQYDWWDSNKDWLLATQKLYPAFLNYPNLQTNTHDTNHDLSVQSDWVQPIGKATLLELGAKIENRKVQYDFLAQQQVGDSYQTFKGLDNGLNYNEHIESAYAQFASKLGKLSYLAGLRLEITNIKSSGRGNHYESHKDYARLFPTFHLDYTLGKTSALQAHYSRRINRPSLYQLSPYIELTDINAQNTGNPSLNPYYSNNYELGFLYQNSTFTINPSLYVQNAKAPITDFTTRYADATFVTFPINIDREIRKGFELNVMYNPLNALQLQADFNCYHFKQSGVYDGLNFGFASNSASGRLTLQWKVLKSLSAQGRYYFNGASANAQSRTRAMHWADFGFSKNLISDRLAVVADVNNVFDSRRYRTTTIGPDYVFTTMSRFNGARYRLSLTYKFKRNATVREAKASNRD